VRKDAHAVETVHGVECFRREQDAGASRKKLVHVGEHLERTHEIEFFHVVKEKNTHCVHRSSLSDSGSVALSLTQYSTLSAGEGAPGIPVVCTMEEHAETPARVFFERFPVPVFRE
jgi:hypothetical protein